MPRSPVVAAFGHDPVKRAGYMMYFPLLSAPLAELIADSPSEYDRLNAILQFGLELFELVNFPLYSVPMGKIKMHTLLLDNYFCTSAINKGGNLISGIVFKCLLFCPVFAARIDNIQTEPVCKSSLKVDSASIARQIADHEPASSYLCDYFVVYVINMFDVINLHSLVTGGCLAPFKKFDSWFNYFFKDVIHLRCKPHCNKTHPGSQVRLSDLSNSLVAFRCNREIVLW